MQQTLYVGFDVHKESISVTVAEDGRDGSVRFLGPYPILRLTLQSWPRGRPRTAIAWNSATKRVVAVKLSTASYRPRPRLHGGRPIEDSPVRATGSRPTAGIPRSSPSCIESGELTRVWVPDELHEAMRDLVRARGSDATMQLTGAGSSFLLSCSGMAESIRRGTSTGQRPPSLACRADFRAASPPDRFPGLSGGRVDRH